MIMPAMMRERTGSIHCRWVKRMAPPPAMTAAVERVSPSMWRKTERMLTSFENFQRRAAIPPFMRTPAMATYIMSLGWTCDGHSDAMDGGEGDPEREDDEGEGVDEGGEDAGALVAEGLAVIGGAGLKVDGDEGEDDGEGMSETL